MNFKEIIAMIAFCVAASMAIAARHADAIAGVFS